MPLKMLLLDDVVNLSALVDQQVAAKAWLLAPFAVIDKRVAKLGDREKIIPI